MTDAVMGTWSYTYDDFNRLTGGSATAGVDSGLALGWTYDRYGNRWAQNATGSGNATAVQPQLSFTGNNNHVDGWSYDAAGNLLNDGRNSYAYDAEGRIVALNGQPMYLYDAEGRRVAKYSGSTVTARYLLDLDGHQVTELNAAGAWMHSNVWTAGGKLLATYEGPGESKPNTWHFHLTDWLGTERMQTNAAGNMEEVCTSYPFGDGLSCTGTDATEHHFTTKERDAESGLDYFYARYYSSILARFMTPDWAAAPTAVPYATFGDPQTLNLYAYVNNNPNTGIDMDGHVDGFGNDLPTGSFEYIDNDKPDQGGGNNGNNGSGSNSTSPSGQTSDENGNDSQFGGGDKSKNVYPVAPKPQNPSPKNPPDNQKQPGQNAPDNDTPWYKTCTAKALGKGAVNLGIDALGFLPEVGGVARVVGHQAGYVGKVADNVGKNMLTAGTKTTGFLNSATGIDSSDWTTWVSAGITAADFVPVLSDFTTPAAMIWDAGTAAYKAYQCP